MSVLVIIRGPLGVGKTTVAQKLAQRTNGKYFSIDQLLAENKLDRGDSISVENFLKLNKILVPLIRECISKGIIVIVDGNFYYKEQLDDLLSQIDNHRVFTLKAPVGVCIERNAGRERVYSEDAVRFVHRMVSKFDYGTIIEIKQKTPQEIVEEILINLLVGYGIYS